MCELLEHNPRLYQIHQNRVKNFLKSKNISAIGIECDNVALYSDVMSLINNPIVDPKHQRQFRKFCRQWLKNRGSLDQKYISSIANRTNYYHNKQYNAMMRERRLARKQQTTV
jgi:hypothetical protein